MAMISIAPQIFLGVNVALFIIGVTIAILLLIFSSRHQFLIGYGDEQKRLRVYTALILIILIALGIGASLFNIIVG